ncbi:hypothetical protein MMC10_005219 [Thelotrema lepadinum]|nr:hypothetical protein [Thelotrema lepadinum]
MTYSNISRSNFENGSKTVKSATEENILVDSVFVDASDTKLLKQALEEVRERLGKTQLECILFNAARVGPSKLMDFPVEDIEKDFQLAVSGLYTSAAWAIPQFQHFTTSTNNSSTSKPTFLVTSGALYADPVPPLFSLSLCRAAQFNLMNSLHQQYKPRGVHFAVVVVAGFVADNAPECNPKNVAQRMWEIHMQSPYDKEK